MVAHLSYAKRRRVRPLNLIVRWHEMSIRLRIANFLGVLVVGEPLSPIPLIPQWS